MVFYHVVRCGSFCCVPQLGALFGGHLGTTPTSQRAAGEREAGYLKAEWALFGGSLGTLPTSPRAMGEREANYLETQWALLGGSLGTLPTSPRATARPLLLPWSFYHGAVSLSWWGEREVGYLEAGCALVGGSLGTLPTSPRAPGEREANYLETECAPFWGSLGTLPTSPRAKARPLLLPWSFYHGAVSLPWWRAAGEREANYLETECALCWGSLGTLPTSPRATARPLLLPWSFYHGAVSLP
jgi:hypothetical protein